MTGHGAPGGAPAPGLGPPPWPVPPARRPAGSRLLPVLGAAWLALTLVPPAAFYIIGFFVGGALRLGCETEAQRCRFSALPVSITGAALGGCAVVVLLVLIRVPHRGRLRWLRGGLLAVLAVLSAVAEGLLFSAWRT